MIVAPLPVLSLVRHLTAYGVTRRQDDWVAYKITRAVKREAFTGYAVLRVGPRRVKLDPDTPHATVIDWCCELFDDCWSTTTWSRAVQFVPVPTAETSSQFVPRVVGTPHALAGRLAARFATSGAIVSDVLSFVLPQARAHNQGGTRDAQKLLANLDCDELRPDLPIVLVDDVMTTGGHLQACESRLRNVGANVLGAIVVSRCVHTQDDHPLQSTVETLPRLAVERTPPDEDLDLPEDEPPQRGLCLRCHEPAVISFASCNVCDSVLDDLIGEQPTHVEYSDGKVIVYFESGEDGSKPGMCGQCFPDDVEYEFEAVCSYCEHVTSKDD